MDNKIIRYELVNGHQLVADYQNGDRVLICEIAWTHDSNTDLFFQMLSLLKNVVNPENKVPLSQVGTVLHKADGYSLQMSLVDGVPEVRVLDLVGQAVYNVVQNQVSGYLLEFMY